MLAGCDHGHAPSTTTASPAATAPAATVTAPPVATAPAPDRAIKVDIHSSYVDGDVVTYAGEAVWATPAGVVSPFVADAATADDWRRLHRALQEKRDYFVKFNTGILPTAKLGLYLFPHHAVPDFAVTRGPSGGAAIAVYDDLLTGAWRYCFGGHAGGGASMAKCIRDADTATATTYQVDAAESE
jgi:hypothetical protein